MKVFVSISLYLAGCLTAIAQPKNEDTAPIAEAATCNQIINLVNEGNYNAAASIIDADLSMASCKSLDYLRALAKLKSAFFEFEEAEKILYTLAMDYPLHEELQREWNHMVYLSTQLGIFQPIAIVPQPNSGENKKMMIAWMEDSVPKMVIEKPAPITYYPIKQQGAPYTTFRDEDMLEKPILETIKKKLESSGYQDIHSVVSLPGLGIIISVVKVSAYAGKGAAYKDELVLFSEEGKLKHSLPYMDCDCNNAYSSYDMADSSLYFSSDRTGGMGGMDIWTMKLRNGRWSEPVNLGAPLNTASHELIPTLSDDTLFFSSDAPYSGFGGFDLYSYHLKEKTVTNLGLPINGPYDDFAFHVLKLGEAIWVTNRNGEIASNQLFKASWSVAENFFDKLKGQITSSTSLLGKEVLLLNDNGDVIDRTTLNFENKFEFKHIKGKDTYHVEIAEGSLSEGSKLQLFDTNDKMINEIVATSDRGFVFELLTPQDYYVAEMANNDESILTLDILGKVEKGGAFKIILLNSEGEEIATTNTDKDGSFQFTSVNADDRYTFKSEVVNGQSPIHILNQAGEIIKTIEPNSLGGYAYVRLDDSDGVITLTNEYQKKIRVSQNDLFALGVVNYEYNSADVPESGALVLDGLAEILRLNPQVRIELEGHTDSKGSASFNLDLSKRRIESAIAYLNKRGIESKRLSGTGYGESRPITPCHEDEDWEEFDHAVNRRIEFRLADMLDSSVGL